LVCPAREGDDEALHALDNLSQESYGCSVNETSEADHVRTQALCSRDFQLLAATRGRSMEHSTPDQGPPPRRGPTVDLDPSGCVTGKSPDRQRHQFLNYAFYRLDPVFRRLPADEQRAAAAGFIELVRTWESSPDVILRTYSLVGLRADVDFMLWRIAFDPLCFQTMEAALRRSQLGAYLSQVHSFLSLQRRSPYVNRTGAGEGHELQRRPPEYELQLRA
jgi:hypothetical protein